MAVTDRIDAVERERPKLSPRSSSRWLVSSELRSANLKKRIVDTMANPVAAKLDFSKKRLLGAAGLIAVTVPILFGQVTASQRGAGSQAEDAAIKPPAYDVVSIKPDRSGIGPRLLFTLDALTATKVTLRFLIKEAYGVEDDEISEVPSWIKSETYDIEAKIDGADIAELRKLTEGQWRLMFQALLADRFKLKVHRETKEIPVYELVIAKNGSTLQEAKPGDTYANGIKDDDGHPVGHAGMMEWGMGRLIGQGIPIASMLPPLSQQLGRTVVNKTGLTGNYDIELRWTPDKGSGPTFAAPGGDQQGAAPTADSSGLSIFTAIQEQLGLKLESTKAPAEILVIDYAERPSVN